MSSWWTINFFATGDLDRIEELERALPSLFHIVVETDRVGAALLVRVTQNYGGAAAMEETVEHYPDLTFNGVKVHEQADAGGSFWGFTGANGQTEWREYRLRDDGRVMTAAEILGEIARIDEKLGRLRKQRGFYEDELRKLEAGTNAVSGATVGSPLATVPDAAVVADIVARLKRKSKAR